MPLPQQSNQEPDYSKIEEQLDIFLDPILSFRRTATAPAKKLSVLSDDVQQYVLSWVEIITATNAEMAFQYADFFTEAYEKFNQDLNLVETWINKAMSAYDEIGLMPAISIIKGVEKHVAEVENKRKGVTFSDHHRLLETFVCGLSGRQLSLAISPIDQAYTDTEKIYLPEVLSDFDYKEANFLLYKTMVVYHWAQTRYGTFREDLSLWLESFEQNSSQALDLYQCFENIRLMSLIQSELPGFYRQMQAVNLPISDLIDQQLAESDPQRKIWQKIIRQLQNRTDSKVSFTLVKENIQQLNPIASIYQGLIQADRVKQVMQLRLEKEKTLFKQMLGELSLDNKDKTDDNDDEKTLEDNEDLSDVSANFSINIKNDEGMPDEMHIELFLEGEMMPVPEHMQSLLESIIQDMGNLPPDYLEAAGPGAYHVKKAEEDKEKTSVWGGTYHEDDAFFYDEWDMLRQNYKKNWCVVREMSITPVYDDFVAKTKEKHLGLIKSIRRTFEALRGEEKLLKRQVNGDDIDIDAVVEGYADLKVGMEMTNRLFTKLQKEERNIAVLFMVDMSGSTKGWINDAERESLILLSEALETLGDRYAIYGFSGIARKRCEIFHVKSFDEPYNDKVKAKISGISAKDYTRMGFAIRHFTHLLEEVEAKTKLLITISDGKPEDYDGQYRGEYGIEDTRQSLFEAKQKGIHSFCITIDETARDYLPHMYGAANYIVINEVAKLPLKVSEIYRKITTR